MSQALDRAFSEFLAVENGSVEQLADWANRWAQDILSRLMAAEDEVSKLRATHRDGFILKLALLKQLGGSIEIEESTFEDIDPYSDEIQSHTRASGSTVMKIVKPAPPASHGEDKP